MGRIRSRDENIRSVEGEHTVSSGIRKTQMARATITATSRTPVGYCSESVSCAASRTPVSNTFSSGPLEGGNDDVGADAVTPAAFIRSLSASMELRFFIFIFFFIFKSVKF